MDKAVLFNWSSSLVSSSSDVYALGGGFDSHKGKRLCVIYCKYLYNLETKKMYVST